MYASHYLSTVSTKERLLINAIYIYLYMYLLCMHLIIISTVSTKERLLINELFIYIYICIYRVCILLSIHSEYEGALVN